MGPALQEVGTQDVERGALWPAALFPLAARVGLHSGGCWGGAVATGPRCQLRNASFPVRPSKALSLPLTECEAGMGTPGSTSGPAVHSYRADRRGKSCLHSWVAVSVPVNHRPGPKVHSPTKKRAVRHLCN